MDYSTMSKEQLQHELEKEVELWENAMREQRTMSHVAEEAAERIADIDHYYRLAKE